ncbi:hypothetical protein VitviT2T_017993 [Vitis vinifera]|uniref:G-type lectin S-receptor-like serine/threonine-protein kinase n=1 Tax=Vitis vinifera TaxID=29760 RepID=A0ABY9CWK6_VITVI|nr:hypothetical protein VitviT2T_017993 [Vitis vinifera]
MRHAIFFFLCSILCCSARDTITPDNLLIDDGRGTLVSANQTFELGFFIPKGGFNNGKYIGIWYYGLKERTVVWVANRDNPLPEDSVGALAIADDGNLKLVNESGAAYWFTNLGSSSSMGRVAKVMDSGNFVLRDNRSGKILWESFKNPTDTFLPGMIMEGNLTLTSWVSPVDPAPGSYTFKQDDDKDQYIIFEDSIVKYWRSEESEGMSSAAAELLSNFGKTRKPTGSQFMIKVRKYDIEFSGKDESECRRECLKTCRCQAYAGVGTIRRGRASTPPKCWIWSEDLGSLQEYNTDGYNLSLRVAKSDIESTVRNCETCGTNLIPYPLSTGPNCGDPMYFSFRCDKATDQVWFALPNGSYRVTSITPERSKFLIQVNDIDNCEARNSQDTKILQLNPPFRIASWCNADTGNSSSSMPMKGQYEIEISWDPPPEPVCNSATDCKDWPNSSCRTQNRTRRCFCNQNFKWNSSSLNCTQDGGNLAEAPTPANQKSSSSSSALVVVVGIVTAVVVVALLCIIGCIAYFRKRTISKGQENRTNPGLHLYHSESRVKDLIDSEQFKEDDKKGIDIPFFDLEDILAATDHFSDANKLGQGGFGPVYKGKFPEGREIAVKRLSRASGQGLQEFKNEVVLIAKLQHRNLVRLLGYCIEGDEKILLYEYMPNKSLDSFIFDQTLCLLLNWEKRFDIILGIARGLLYLHQDSRLKIIHRDLKTSNILLDDEMNPKISDFGLARIFESKQVEASTNRVVGTYGYMSPEYALDGFFSEKSDVFSFGVVVLEIISGKRNTRSYQSDLNLSLLAHAWKLWKEDRVLELMDQTLSQTCNTNEFLRCVNVGLLCVQEDPSDRPTMAVAVVMLSSDTATLPVPKQPAFVVRRDLSSSASSSSKPEASLNSEILATIEEARDTIRQNDPISDGDGETLLSAGKTFELGFFTPNGSSSHQRYVGIWYYRLEPKTVVWVANRNDPLPDSTGVLSIQDGNLVLNSNGRGRPFWSTPLQKSSSTEKVAQLIDSGNLVLKNDQLQTSLWQSFGNATDTFLPGMKMDGNLVLTSWKSSSDPGSGNFTFRKDQVAQNLYIIQNGPNTYWKSGISDDFITSGWDHKIDCNNCQAYAYVEAETRADTAICMIWEENLNDIQEAYLDGGHDLYVRVAVSDIEPMGRNCKICGTNIIPYPLSTGTDCGDPKYLSFYCENSTGQVIFMRPNNTYYQVTSIRPEAKEFSIQLGEDNCIASSDAMKKLLEFNQDSPFLVKSGCTAEKSTSSLYPFSDAEWLREIQIEWRPPLEPICNSTEDCKYWAHSNCNTTGDGQKRCHCKINYQWDPTNVSCFPVEAGPSQRKQQPYVIFIGSVVAVIVISCFTVFIYYLRRRRVSEMQEHRGSIQGNPVLHLYHSERRVKDLIGWGQFTEDDREGIDVPFFDLGSILAATNNLSDANKLGQGGFGPVYKGSFPGGQDIAVKRLSSVSGQGLEEFKNEVVLIAKLQHRNLVRLLGYCVEEDEKILLYEYMPNKSLDSFIFDRTLRFLLNWEKRFDIILGIARGLLYLHQDSRLRIIHRDLKTSNILLDEEMNPKISDFGLARIFGGKQTEASTNRVVGTYGYMSPEYALDGFFSIKSDVFSFGVVVLEIISGKRNTGFYQSQQALSLLGYAWRLWQENKALDLMDQSLHETCDVAEFLRCVNVGLLCVQEDPSDRPVMSNVVFLLGSETATLPTPKQPAFTVRRGVFSTASSSSKPETCTNELTVSVDGR